MLEPILDDTDMSALPCFMLMTDVSKSGTLVPAANNVRPIIIGGMPIAYPNIVAHQTMNYDTNIIAQNDSRNDRKNKCSFSFSRESGIPHNNRRIGSSNS